MNKLPAFALEHYLLLNEHKAELSLCNSGLDSLGLKELLALADEDSLALWEGQNLGYSEPQGHLLLRREVSGLYSGLEPTGAVLFSGAAEAIYCGLHALLAPGDHCIVITPCYQSLLAIPESLCETTRLPLRPEPRRWELDMASVRQAVRPNTRVLVMNFPNNPTGALPEASVLAELVALAREFDLTIFSDEVYRGMELEPESQWPALVEAYEKGVSVGSMSKRFAVPGARVGWLASKDQAFLARVTGFKHYSTICNNGPGELLALMALRVKDVLLSRHQTSLERRFVQMQDFLDRHPDWFEWIVPQAGCLVFPRLREGYCARQFALDLLDQQKVLVLPGHLYDFPGNHLRLSYASKTLPQALQRLETFLESLSPGQRSPVGLTNPG